MCVRLPAVTRNRASTSTTTGSARSCWPKPLAGETRPFTPTAIEEPGSPGRSLRAARTCSAGSRIDDGLGSQNPSFMRHPNGAAFSLTNYFRGGDTVTDAVGVDGLRLQPLPHSANRTSDLHRGQPAPGGARRHGRPSDSGCTEHAQLLPDARYDVERHAARSCGGNANLECRGADADQPTEFTRQRDKLMAPSRASTPT